MATKNTKKTIASRGGKVAATITRTRMYEIANAYANGCVTRKQVSAQYSQILAEVGGDKSVAVEIQRLAKEIVANRSASIKASAANVRTYLSDGRKIAQVAWDAYLREGDSKSFAKLVYASCDGNLDWMIRKYATLVTERTIHGIVCTRVSVEDEDGNKRTEIKAKNLASVGGYMSALKTAVNNAKRDALGEDVNKWQKVVTITLE